MELVETHTSHELVHKLHVRIKLKSSVVDDLGVGKKNRNDQFSMQAGQNKMLRDRGMVA